MSNSVAYFSQEQKKAKGTLLPLAPGQIPLSQLPKTVALDQQVSYIQGDQSASSEEPETDMSWTELGIISATLDDEQGNGLPMRPMRLTGSLSVTQNANLIKKI